MAHNPPPLTPQQRAAWNQFIDYVAAQKMAGHPSLDQRNMQVGMDLLGKFNKAYPNQALPPEIVPQVQQEMNDYRTAMLERIKSGKAQFNGKPEEFMPNLSATDGWPGTKTLSSKFPAWIESRTTPKGTTTVDSGPSYGDYDKGLAGVMYKGAK